MISERTQVLPRVTAGLSRPADEGRAAIVAAAAGAAAVAILRITLLFRYRIDSDETQHLHVAWAWANGMLQYRDLFDNHMPLFHILFAPLVRMVGERTEILFLARIAALPLFASMVLLTNSIGRSAYPRRAAAWATLIGCLVPDFFLCSLEFRTDDLWAVCWLASIAILVSARLNPSRSAAAGLMLGLAAAVSAKTTLLAVCLGIAALATHFLTRPRSRLAARATAFAAAALVPPGLLASYFAWRGAWQPFIHCTVAHNLVASEHPNRLLLLPLSLAVIVIVARRILRDDVPPEVRKRRLFLFLTASSYSAALISLWPIIETEHWLPFYPLIAVAVVPRLLPSEPVRQRRVALVAASALILWIALLGAPWRDNTSPSVSLIAQTLRLTRPGERVVDLKGEMLFRRRATYCVFEKITKRGIAKGRLQDTIASDVLRTGAMVAIPDNDSFPRQGRAFLNRNFVRVGAVRVAGVIVSSSSFRIEVPGDYSVIAEHGVFQGLLDGTPVRGPRALTAGIHTLDATASGNRYAVIWQRAAAYELSPWEFAPAPSPR